LDGHRLREARLARRLSQAKLGQLVGVGKSAISQYEHGRRSPDDRVLLRLAEVLGTSVDWLLGRAEEEGVVREDRIPYRTGNSLPSPSATEEDDEFLAALTLQARSIASAADRTLLLNLARSLAAKNSSPSGHETRPPRPHRKRR